jgi:hypothetical protein
MIGNRNFVARSVMSKAKPKENPRKSTTQFDFFLFGYVKDRLQEIVFTSHEELLAGISEVLDEIRLETLPRVFEP